MEYENPDMVGLLLQALQQANLPLEIVKIARWPTKQLPQLPTQMRT